MSKRPTLTERLAAVRANSSTEMTARYDRLVQALRDADVAAGALKVGDECPAFVLANADGNLVASADLLEKGPLVLSFYRGRWCPYCVTELEALSEAWPQISAKGATLAAVTAECGGGALAARRDKALPFEILCDIENGLALEFGLLFRLPREVRDYYQSIKIDFPVLYGNESHFLPIPGTFVIGQNGVIQHAYVNPDFRERLEPDAIVKALDGVTK
jgi:peroxiredoxin